MQYITLYIYILPGKATAVDREEMYHMCVRKIAQDANEIKVRWSC
jgi:hypothetical protein